MSNSAGIFQVDELLAEKLRGSGLEEHVEVIARIEAEHEQRLIPVLSDLNRGVQWAPRGYPSSPDLPGCERVTGKRLRLLTIISSGVAIVLLACSPC